MFKHFFFILIAGGLGCFLYGIWNIFLEVEENKCRMTYMFSAPQFSRVNVAGNSEFPNYGLYYYYEGQRLIDVNSLKLRGAPVLFMPGSAGSHKQVRSFASVALRKTIDSNAGVHFDYFAVSINEEHSGIFGGYLEMQKAYLQLCIRSVLQLYRSSPHGARKVVIIGHSMGGKVAQALFSSDASMANLINTIIFISTPLDAPVVNFDILMQNFYVDSFRNMSKYRPTHNDSSSNACTGLTAHNDAKPPSNESSYLLDNVLLISVGGGNRDLIVRDGLTKSIFNDLHSMTSAIPKVWLSCDHMSSVWCLQFVLATNRFLFSIVARGADGFITFREDKSYRLRWAQHHFVRPKVQGKVQLYNFGRAAEQDVWQQCSKRVLQKHFKAGVPKAYNLMISLKKYEKFKKLYVEMLNAHDSDWLYGCVAQQRTPDKFICEQGHTLAHHIQAAISLGDVVSRSEALLDLHNLRKTFSNWTHIVVRMAPTYNSKPCGFNLDVHEPADRVVRVKAPRWFNYVERPLMVETAQGTLYYKILISDLQDSYQALKLNIRPLACLNDAAAYQVRTKICVPWARGYERQQILTEKTSAHIFVNAPMASPLGYNTTLNPISVEIYLDPACRFSISSQYSISNTLSRIVLEFYNWLPSHLIAVLCIVLKNQLSQLQQRTGNSASAGGAVETKSPRPYASYFQYTSLYIITSCRILRKLLPPVPHLAAAGVSQHPAYGFPAVVILHSSAIAMSVLLSLAIWLLIVLHGSLLHNIAVRFTRLPLDSFTLLITFVTKLPLAIGVLTIAIALSTCSCVALLLNCCIYLILLSNAYKDRVEGWLWTQGGNMLNKLYKRVRRHPASAPTRGDSDKAEGTLATAPLATTNAPADGHAAETDVEAGLQQFPYHITMFLLLFIITLLNVPAGVAWLRNYRTGPRLPDPALPSTIVILANLSLLWQLNAPNQFYGGKLISVVLYLLAGSAVLYCQEAVHQLNYIVAIVYTAVLIPEVVRKLWLSLKAE